MTMPTQHSPMGKLHVKIRRSKTHCYAQSRYTEMIGTTYPHNEYAYSTLVSSSSKLPPFFVDMGRTPNNHIIAGAGATGVALSRKEYASRFIPHRQQVIERARRNRLGAQAAQQKFYDKKRADNPFKVGDLAFLEAQDLSISLATDETMLRSKKIILPFIGPFAILEVTGNVVLLDVPANLKHIGQHRQAQEVYQ